MIQDHTTAILAALGLTREALAGPARDAETTQKRQVVAAALRRYGYTLAQIGAVIQRHHSTVHHAVELVESQRRIYPEVQALLTTAMAAVDQYENSDIIIALTTGSR